MIKPHHYAVVMLCIMVIIALIFSAYGYLYASLVFLGGACFFGRLAIKRHDEYLIERGE